METRFVIRNEKEVQAFLKSLPRGAMQTGLDSLSEYFIGNNQRGLRHSEPYKYVTRKAAYGKTFFSPAQRGYVMAKIRSGEITPGKPKRTGASAADWGIQVTNNGYGRSIVSNLRSNYFIRSDKGQARQPAMVGWRKVSKVVQDNMAGAIRHAVAEVKKWIRANKPKS